MYNERENMIGCLLGGLFMYKDSIFNTTILCIDQYVDQTPVGRAYSAAYNGGVTFRSTIDLLTKLESILEETNAPQSYSCRRVFRPKSDRQQPETILEDLKVGKVATFSLRIMFRQNSSWQGSLLWHEGRQEETFRSVLELLLLIDSALSFEK